VDASCSSKFLIKAVKFTKDELGPLLFTYACELSVWDFKISISKVISSNFSRKPRHDLQHLILTGVTILWGESFSLAGPDLGSRSKQDTCSHCKSGTVATTPKSM
jgi:hypothetical protein